MRQGVSLQVNCYMDDEGKSRCDRHGKVAYTSERYAADVVTGMRRVGFPAGKNFEHYKAECGYWHLTSKEKVG
ncbi:MAG: hypothetical protein J4F40_18670 [Alphaproteobacteria bacterium]|nr:hypothetical protein [Alphaproteobacteria bacterium]